MTNLPVEVIARRVGLRESFFGDRVGFFEGGLLQIVANFVTVLILARLSWVLLESPFLRLKRYFRYGTHSTIESAAILAPASDPILVHHCGDSP